MTKSYIEEIYKEIDQRLDNKIYQGSLRHDELTCLIMILEKCPQKEISLNNKLIIKSLIKKLSSEFLEIEI